MRILELDTPESLGVIPMADITVHAQLLAGVAAEFPIPTEATKAHFSCGVEFFVAEGNVAVVPTSTPTEGKIERSPVIRQLQPGIEFLSIVSPNTGYMTVSFYA